MKARYFATLIVSMILLSALGTLGVMLLMLAVIGQLGPDVAGAGLVIAGGSWVTFAVAAIWFISECEINELLSGHS